jgi:ATP-dependent DNA helicase RecG
MGTWSKKGLFKAVGRAYRTSHEQVTEQVQRLLTALIEGPASSAVLMEALRLSHRPSFLHSYLQPAIAARWVEMTIPDKPRSSSQKYRLTQKGRGFVAKLAKEIGADGK